jgi:hypothetical protein
MNCRQNLRRQKAGCGRPRGVLRTFADVVSDYKKYHRPSAQRVLEFYRSLPTLRLAIEHASAARQCETRRHPHQYRLSRRTLADVGRKLLKANAEIESCSDFDALFELIKTKIGTTKGVGELMVYDTAHRIGVRLGLQPTKVYLHRGTRDGALALGKGKGAKALDKKEFGRMFCSLAPHEIEDCLCIYKDELRRLRS